MKRHLRLLAGLAAIPLALGACSTPADSPSTGTTDPTDQVAPIELWTAWTEGAATAEASLAMIDKFEQTTGFQVNQTNFTYDMLHDKIVTSAAGGNLPDVIWGLPEYVGEFERLGILSDLTAAWDAWPDRDKVSDAVKTAMTINGKIIGFPYETTVRAYLVHDDLLAQAGVSVPTTWEEVLAVGSTVQDATDSSFFGLTGTGVRAPQELLVYLAQQGLVIAEPVNGGYQNTWADNPDQLAKAAATFQFYADLISSGAASPNSPTYGWEETDENFATGLNATFVSGNWLGEREQTNADTMADVSVHPIPYPQDGQPATYLESKPMMVLSTTDVLDPATQLAQWWASEEWQTAAFANRSALEGVSTDSKWSRDFQALLSTGIVYPPVTLSTITQNMIDSLAMVLQEGKSPQETAAWLSQAINDSLEQSGELGQ
jgi:ABC-type glycerol-3-phosphate transport system substrate-binding protein